MNYWLFWAATMPLLMAAMVLVMLIWPEAPTLVFVLLGVIHGIGSGVTHSIIWGI